MTPFLLWIKQLIKDSLIDKMR